MMTTKDVANKVVELTSKGKFREALELYSPDIVSVEPSASGTDREMKGIDAVRGKTDWWEKSHEVHSSVVKGPLVAGSQFAVV